MTFQETAKIMAVFKAAYPRYYANIDVEEATGNNIMGVYACRLQL